MIKLLIDCADLSRASEMPLGLLEMIDRAHSIYASALPKVAEGWQGALAEFLTEREMHLFERRGFRGDEVRAVVPVWWQRPQNALRRIEALAQARRGKEFETLALLFKRVKNITKDFDIPLTDEMRSILVEPAEQELLKAVESRWPKIASALQREEYREAMTELGALSAPVDRFFVDVLVMAEDRAMREARLALLTSLRRTIMNIADIAEIAPEHA
jgi:glycyl-tRNA synthetase beta chain